MNQRVRLKFILGKLFIKTDEKKVRYSFSKLEIY